MYVISDVSRQIKRTPLTADDRLLRLKKTSQTEKGWSVDKMTVEFPARQLEMAYDL